MAVTKNQMDVSVVPSNQHHNVAGGDPNPEPGVTTEEQIQVISALAAVDELQRQGHNAKLFWIPGAGDKSTDELYRMCVQSRAWLKSQPGYSYALSFHSNAGHASVVPDDLYMYPLVKASADTAWGLSCAKDAATRTGFRSRSATVRSITFMSVHSYLPANRVLLMEVGEHQDSLGAAYLWKWAQFHGIMVARAFVTASGKFTLRDDGPVPEGVPVPPGAQFDKYRPTATQPPVVEVPQYTRLLKYTSPMMHGEDVGYVQETLVKHGYSVGRWGVDTWFGEGTRDGVIAFQRDVFADHAEWDGIVGPKTWSQLEGME